MPGDKQREPIEIKMDLCEFLFNYGVQKVTRIEHACNLRDDLCKQYLAELTDLQFIRKNENDEYEIMERGIGFLGDTIELFVTHFPERRKKVEGDRIWRPIKRVPKIEKVSQSENTV
ncbi:MAG: winged helix-turn-helix domain-containing protein [Candidatus Bathyarchaeia archaeon]